MTEKVPMSEILQRQIHREELGIAIANSMLKDEDLSIIEAVLEDQHFELKHDGGVMIYEVWVKKENPCEKCGGEGTIAYRGHYWPASHMSEKKCPTCKGTGRKP